MKRVATAALLTLTCLFFTVGTASAQFERNWELSDNVNSSQKPSYLSDARALAYGTVSDGSGNMVERLLVSHGGNTVEIVDPSDGQNLGTLSTNGISGTSTRNIQDVEITEDNLIIGCNSVSNPFAQGDVDEFRCYRWDDLSADPTQIVGFTPPDADGSDGPDYLGRLIDVRGAASDNSLTITTAASAFNGVNDVYRFTTSDNAQSFSASTVDRADGEPFDNLNGVAALGGGSSPFIYNAGGALPTRYASDGSSPEAVPQGVVSSFTNSTYYFEVGSNNYFVAFNYEQNGSGSLATIVDVTNGFGSALPYGSTPSMGGAPANGTGDVDVRKNGDGTVTLFVVSTGVGIGSYTTTQGPLPVELTTFEAQRDAEAVQLTWQTASETNNAGFHIERSMDGTSFTAVGYRSGAGTTTETTSYRFRDTDLPFTAETVTYRLRQVDRDGSVEYSRKVTVDLGTPQQVQLLGSTPNPVAGQATIRYALPAAGEVHLAIYDVLGREVATLTTGQKEARRHVSRFDASDLASGTYLIRLQANGEVKTRKLTVVQ
jgi:hypothetical protein